MSDSQIDPIRQLYQAGRDAFEHGAYRQSVDYFEKATNSVDRMSRLGGEIQIWLVTAYQANGQQQEAIALCKRVSLHPDYETAKQGKRLLYILEAPKLKTKPEWMTQIPDLGSIEKQDGSDLVQKYTASPSKKPRLPQSKTKQTMEPIDPSQIDTRDNGFVWIALFVIAIMLGGLVWLN